MSTDTTYKDSQSGSFDLDTFENIKSTTGSVEQVFSSRSLSVNIMLKSGTLKEVSTTEFFTN